MADAPRVTFVLKNPAMTQEVSVTVPLDGDVAGLKSSIRDAYPGSPSTSQLILIYAGKVLKNDAEALSSFLKPNVTPDSPQILHVVVQGQATDGTARTSAGASSSAPTASPAPRAADAVRMQHAGAAAPSAARPPPGTAAPAGPDPELPRRPRPQTAHPAIKGLAEVLHLNAAAVASASMSAAYAAALAVLGHPIPQPLVEGGAGPPAPVHMPQAPQQVLAQTMLRNNAAGHVQHPNIQVTFLRQRVQHQRDPGAEPAAPAQGPGLAPGALPLLQLLREREARGDLPPNVRALLENLERLQGPGLDRGHRPRPAAAPRPHPAVRLRRWAAQNGMQLNARALLQLGVLLAVVYQHCPPQRFFALLTLGLLLFLTTTEPVRRFLAQLGRVRAGPAVAPVPEAGPPRAVAGPGDADAGMPAAELEARPAEEGPAPQAPAPRGLVQEALAVLVGFFSSILPGWQADPAEAAAHAAAQAAWPEDQDMPVLG
ncbi:hypothetical protein ACKKBF_B03690 [Auxenochlorella protothecoides x Auxenochlorella symbiontica]